MGASRSVVVLIVGAALAAGLVGGAAQWVHDAPRGWGSATTAVALTVAGAGWALAGAVLAWHRPGNRLGWLVLAVGALTQLSLTEEAIYLGRLGASTSPVDPWADRAPGLALSVLVGAAVFLLLGLLPVLYPTGTLPSRGWMLPVALVTCGAVLLQLQWLCHALGYGWDWPLEGGARQPNAIAVWLPFAGYVTGVALGWLGGLVRWHRAAHPERQQLAWLLCAVVLILTVPVVGDSVLGMALQALTLYTLPAAIVVGILRYRLLDIDVVVRRVLTYAVLTATIAVLHATVVYLGQSWLDGGRLPSVAAAAVVAVGVLPLRGRVQGAVDRFFFGGRQEPLAAVSALGDTVASAHAFELHSDLLLAVATQVRSTLRSAGVRIDGTDGRILAQAGTFPSTGSVALPLLAGGQHLGELQISPRRPGERYSVADAHLIQALAPQVALAVRLVDLARELENQRDRVVGARREERERLRRDIHDGLGPSMTGIKLGLQAVQDLLPAGQDSPAHDLTAALRRETAIAVGELRRIVDGLRPGSVEALGLSAALRDALGPSGTGPRVLLDLENVRATTAVQDVVYRVALEATHNAVRHARASTIRVSLHQGPHGVELEVGDDGIGIDMGAAGGVGLASMQARAEQVGGELEIRDTGSGTCVRLLLPAGVSPARVEELT